MPDFHKGAVLYRKLRHRKGHGVHSPFVYNLITKVIEEKTPYYAFEQIKKATQEANYQRNRIKFPRPKKVYEHKYGALLFRLINFFKCKVVLQVGSPEETIALYMASTDSECKCIVLEEDHAISSKITELAAKTGLNNLQIRCGDYPEKIKEIFDQEKRIDLVFMNIPGRPCCREILSECVSNADENCIFILNGIRKNEEMKQLWKEVIQDSRITISIDLYTSGIFFRKNSYKQHYKTYFDHGKEQSLHKNRRQRFYFFGGRKKGA
jgi:precorrin-6B methylase 2